MKERYKPFLETELVKIYQKGDKTLIINKREITFQTSDRILKKEIGERNSIKEKNNGH